ncbi:EndoU domain-containing protein [uncultured Olleya sp.]|uniref:EndoU domain-containing protein n=1 Tax=uncultured Olleya sp. TaxID=757243 RepID=UPI00259291D5|nr:EndoU domain-containing protein [uncultured Olleya sp.]
MNTNKYGETYFKKSNFGSIVVFSDEINKFPPEEEYEVSENDYINIIQNEETGQWIGRGADRLGGEYGDFIIQEEQLSPIGTITATETSIFFNQEEDYGDDLMDYYLIDGKYYLQINKNITLNEVVIEVKNNSIWLPQDQKLNTFVTVFVSSDGAKLERAYQRIDNILPRELVLFVEKNDSTNIFGSVFRVKSSNDVDSASIYSKIELSRLVRSYTNDKTIDLSVINDLLVNYYDSRDDESLFLWLPRLATSFIKLTGEAVLSGIGEAMLIISDGIEKDLKLDDNRWQATIDGKKNEKYKPLLPGYDYLKDDTTANSISSYINKTFINPLTGSVIDLIAELNGNSIIKKLIGNKLDALLNFVKQIPKQITSTIESVFNFLKKAFEFFNALIVGIINSIVDLLKSIFDILALICKGLYAVIAGADHIAQNPKSSFGLIIEAFENLISTVLSAFTIDNLKAFFSFQLHVIFSLGKLSFIAAQKTADFLTSDPTEDDYSLPFDAIGYYTGYIIGWLAQEVAIFMATAGVGTITKGIQGAVRSYKELFTAISKTASKIAKGAHKKIKLTVEAFLSGLRALGNFVKQIPKHLDNLKRWIDEMIASLQAKALLIDGVAYSLVDPISIFAKSLFRIFKSKSWEQINNLGVDMLKNKDGLYRFIHNGTELAQDLSKPQAEAFLKDIFKKLKDKTDDVAKKYLDELVEAKEIIKLITDNVIQHAKKGEFALPGNPKLSTLPGKMKSGGHGQSNLDFLVEIGRGYKIEHTFENGVRIGSVDKHKHNIKKMIDGKVVTGQSWFPKHWDDVKIKKAFEYVIEKNTKAFQKLKDGPPPLFDVYDEVRVGVLKTKGKPATIFPDNALQPRKNSKKFESNPFK